jgi:PucR C-terminal helix-turn-helix domain/GGDEF-like domain
VVDAVGVVVQRLRARRAEIVTAIFMRVCDVVPDPIGLADAEYVVGLRQAVAAAVDYGLVGIEWGREGSGPAPAAAVAQAQRAARSGVSLDTVLRRYTAGYTLLEDFVVQEAESCDLVSQPRALRGVLSAHASVLESLTAAVAEEYRRELRRVACSPEHRLLERVRVLLAEEAPHGLPGAAARSNGGGDLDYNFEAEHLAVIATGVRAREAVHGLAMGLDRRLLSVGRCDGTTWAWFGGQCSVDMAELERSFSAQGAGEDVFLVVGEPARGIAGWRLTHRQAQAALTVALRKPQPFTRYADVALLAMVLKDEALAAALIEIYISPLNDARNGGRVLRETLLAYLRAERNISSAAAALGVVRKTVESRLRKIEGRLGRSLHLCPAELEVALRLDELNTTGSLRFNDRMK